MTKLHDRLMALTDKDGELEDALFAILEEHVPQELRERVRELYNELTSNHFSAGFYELAALYGALIALMPDDVPQIRAAFQATVFSADRNDEEDWERLERENK